MPRRSSEQLISDIYEAAAYPDRWPDTLDAMADHVDAMGSLFIILSPSGITWTASPRITGVVAEYAELGLLDDPSRTAPLVAEMHPGFRAEIDYRSIEEIEALPAYRDCLSSHGYVGGVGTVMQGVEHDALLIAVESFGCHRQAAEAVPYLDRLRPHLGRALSLSAKIRTLRTSAVVEGLSAINVAAAVIRGDGRLRSMNDCFAKRLGNLMIDPLGRVRFLNPRLDAAFSEALERRIDAGAASRSLAVPSDDDGKAFVLHLLPLPGASRDLFEADGLLLVVADGNNSSVPDADLLRTLFDLTPAEARLARALGTGFSLAEAAARLKVTEGTARVQLRGVFMKTGVSRQSQLVQLLSGFTF
ncbi:hypothetical protein [Sphingomonas sp.]|jgi:DNA-binding CsgD family transcriptional regulator|uniref:helix-turn-helix transcriptional regulator n=1 Tax=Sphingomonas sp. TaxID=28214 RepID=UPI002EDB1646